MTSSSRGLTSRAPSLSTPSIGRLTVDRSDGSGSRRILSNDWLENVFTADIHNANVMNGKTVRSEIAFLSRALAWFRSQFSLEAGSGSYAMDRVGWGAR